MRRPRARDRRDPLDPRAPALPRRRRPAVADDPRLYLRQIEIGPMQNFAYLVGDREKREAVVIDAAWDVDALIDIAAQDDMKITAGLVTHFHPDHLGGSMMGMQITGAAELI